MDLIVLSLFTSCGILSIFPNASSIFIVVVQVSNSSPDLVYRKLVEDVNKLTESPSEAAPQAPQQTSAHPTITLPSNDDVKQCSQQQQQQTTVTSTQPDILLPMKPIPSLPDVSQTADCHPVPGPQSPYATKSLDRADKSKTLPSNSGANPKALGPMMLAAMNGLTLSRPDLVNDKPEEHGMQVDPRVCYFSVIL